MEFDREVTAALERMSIYLRERLRARLVQHVEGEGRETVTAADLTAVRAGGMGMMGRGQPDERLPDRPWPALAGAYRVLDADAAVAVCTLASEDLADELGDPQGVAIIGRAFTENLGAEKVAVNVVANAAIRTLVLCGTESQHSVGQTLRALHSDGLDGEGRVVGSEGPVPLLRNFPAEAQEIFSEKLTVVDLIDETDPATILGAIADAVASAPDAWPEAWAPPAADADAVLSSTGGAMRMARPDDAAGFILITLGPHGDRIVAEHYSRDAELLHVVAAPAAEAVCRQLVECGALSELGHATYIGREAHKAELALQHGLPYEQDRPLTLPPADAD